MAAAAARRDRRGALIGTGGGGGGENFTARKLTVYNSATAKDSAKMVLYKQMRKSLGNLMKLIWKQSNDK